MRKYIEIPYNEILMRGAYDECQGDKVIIITHGIGGNKLGHKFIFRQFSDECNKANISTIRMDFVGSGESDGKFEETVHSDQINQVLEIIKFAKNKLGYKKIILCSTTIGCYSVWHAAQIEQNISGMINWNPIGNFDRYEASNHSSANQNGEIDLNGLYLKKTYLDDLHKLKRAVPIFDGPLICIQGELDFETEYNEIFEICQKNKWQYLKIDNANHLWEGNDVRKELFEKTIKFATDID